MYNVLRLLKLYECARFFHSKDTKKILTKVEGTYESEVTPVPLFKRSISMESTKSKVEENQMFESPCPSYRIS